MYAEIWRTSYWMLEQAETEPKGSFFQIMGSLIFTAFTLEAYLNHIGERIFTCWDDLEQLSPQKKLNVIAEKLEVEKDYSKRPFQTVKQLFKFRNAIAHGKSEFLKSEDLISVTSVQINEPIGKVLEPEWEKYCNLKNAVLAREDVEKIIRILHTSSGSDEKLFFQGMSGTLGQLVSK